jgi:hypothetical protein
MESDTVSAWITDGSLPVFSDTWRLRASHRALFGINTRYEGLADGNVSVGSVALQRSSDEDQLFAEAEWALLFPGGVERYFQKPGLFDENTPVVLQGFLEGKWMNRLLGTQAWRPASVGNNVLADGPGIATSIAAIERGAISGTVSVAYTPARADSPLTFHAMVEDLRGHNLLGLVREVFRVCNEHNRSVDVIDLGAMGEHSAVVNEKARLRQAARMGRLPIPNPLNLAPHRAKERLVRQALSEGIDVPKGATISLEVRDGSDGIAGSGRATLVG